MQLKPSLSLVSRAINTLCCGDSKFSLCGRLYGKRLEGHKGAIVGVRIIDKVFWFDKNHCRESYLQSWRRKHVQ